MTSYDLFNGDADGICALQQLRLDQPLETTLVTGLKRDINLFSRVEAAAGDRITALDVSFDKNRDGVAAALTAGARVFYADHHFPGELIESPNLDLHIHTDANTCTSLIVNELLQNRHYAWAITGAYGDNLYDSAEQLAERHEVNPGDRAALKQLGTLLNYNGYGFTLDDLVFHPAVLFQQIREFENPLDFIATEAYQKLDQAHAEDISSTDSLDPVAVESQGAIFILPDEAWARRVNGVFSNDLARAHPERAHAVLVRIAGHGYRVSVRAPLNNKTGADELCGQFSGGGGRKAAAGINELPEDQFDHFRTRFFTQFGAYSVK